MAHDPIELTSAGVELGRDYSEPIIGHKQGRERALAAYAKLRAS
jgi:deoxyribodipyrimidine photo-lyase